MKRHVRILARKPSQPGTTQAAARSEPPQPAAGHPLLRLRRTVGNQAVQRQLQPISETRSPTQQRVLRGLIEIARAYPTDGAARREPLRELFLSVPADQAGALYARLEPGAASDDFAQYFIRQFPITRARALDVLRARISEQPVARDVEQTQAARPAAIATVADSPLYIENAFSSLGMPIWGGAFYFSTASTFSPLSPDNIILPRSMV